MADACDKCVPGVAMNSWSAFLILAYIHYLFDCRPNTVDETYQYLMSNFQRHYTTSKAPFGIYLTANAWFQDAQYRLQAYKKFLNDILVNDDVYVVPIARVRK